MHVGRDKKEEATVSSEAEENKTLVRRLFEARGKTDLDALDKMLAPDFLSHTRVLPGQQLDREGYKQMTLEYAAAFSNTRFTVEEQVAEADKVVSRFTVHATHDRREFLGVAPTGRKTTYNAIFIHRISGGKIAEADRLINPATYSCHNDEREYAAEWLLNGVRVGEENLLKHLRLA